MSGTYTLGDEAMEEIRASQAFGDPPPEMGEALEEFLYTAFSGGNAVSLAQAKARLDQKSRQTPYFSAGKNSERPI